MIRSTTPHHGRSFVSRQHPAPKPTAGAARRGTFVAVHGSRCICHTCVRRAETGRLAA